MMDPTKKPKRTRICGPQSKKGCFTCKSRRIKCDEERPKCLRCARSGRLCQGYEDPERGNALAANLPSEASRADTLLCHRRLNEPDPSRALSIRCPQTERQHRLGQLGIGLLTFDSFTRFGASGVVLDILLPQMCYSIPSVSAAATALGAVHEMQASYNSISPVDQRFAVSQYQIALRVLQQDLLTQPHGPTPLILICFMLSTAEMFLQQETNALFHLQGAFKLIQHRKSEGNASGPAHSGTLKIESLSQQDDLEIVLLTIDFHICSYALSKTPDLPPISIPSILPSTFDLNSAHTIFVQLVHACYHFTSNVYKFKYQPHYANASVYIEQGRHISHLSTWLEKFDLNVLPRLREDSPLKLYSHGLTLRMTVLSILIYLSCILCPYETAYDTHASRFKQIIANADAIISARRPESDHLVKGIDGQRFTTGPGLIQPLFLTAWKCRDPLNRRRAIRLLSLTGREGPWVGKREACVTTRIMELEEKVSTEFSPTLHSTHRSFYTSSLKDGMKNGAETKVSLQAIARAKDRVGTELAATIDVLQAEPAFGEACSPTTPSGHFTNRTKPTCAAEIVESARIKEMGLSSERINDSSLNMVQMRLSQCREMKAMLSYPCGHGPSQNPNLDSHSQGPCPENIYWEIWTEILQF